MYYAHVGPLMVPSMGGTGTTAMVIMVTTPMGTANPWIFHRVCGAEDHQGFSFWSFRLLIACSLGIHSNFNMVNNQPCYEAYNAVETLIDPLLLPMKLATSGSSSGMSNANCQTVKQDNNTNSSNRKLFASLNRSNT
jgi:hypothetical protein